VIILIFIMYKTIIDLKNFIK